MSPPEDRLLYHLVPDDDWQAASATDFYRPSSLDSDGFVHCSTLTQIPGTAQRFYAEEHNMRVLVISANRLAAPVIDEDLYGHGSFPHIYGPIETDAVVEVMTLERDPDGSFRV